MKKKLFKNLIVVILVVFVAGTSFAADDSNFKTSITVNPLALIFGIFNAEGNIRIADSLSFTVNGSYFSISSGYWKSTAFGIGGGLRYYWQGTAVHKWYVGPLLELDFASSKYTDPFTGTTASGSATGISFGGLVGYESIWDSGVVLDIGIGAQVVSIPSVTVDLGGGVSASSGDISATLPLIKLALGYAF